LYDKMGYTVVRINYLGDWGKNIGLLGVGWKKYGLGKDLDQQTDLFRYMHELYAKMEDELEPEQEARKKAREAGEDTSVLESQGLFAERDLTFKQIEDGEPEAIALWKKLRDITIAYYVNAYARLNIEFDEYSGESQVSLNSEAVAEVEAALRENGIYEEQNGAWVIDFDKHGTKLGNATLRNRNGSTTYLLRDIATVIDRLKTHSFDKMVYIVCEQDVHFRQVVKAVELMGRVDVAAKLQHMSFPRGTGPPSPAGHVQLLGDILDQCETRTREAIAAKPSAYPFADHSAAAKALGLNSLLLQELSSRKCHSNGLDLSLLSLSEGDTGTSLQLCYARLCATIANLPSPPGSDELSRLDYSPFWEPPWCDLLRLMARYPDVIHAAFKTLEPGAVLSYLFRLVEELAACLDEADEEEEGQSEVQGKARVARAVLYDCVRQVLENGMKLLGTIPVCT
jgi:arginyl-tRNA synthetase